MNVSLTPREKTICDGLLEGKRYKEIARDLGLTPRTVDANAQKVYAKLKVTSKASLYAKLRGMHSPDRLAAIEERLSKLEEKAK